MLNKRRTAQRMRLAASAAAMMLAVVMGAGNCFAQQTLSDPLEKKFFEAETAADKEQGIELFKSLLSEPGIRDAKSKGALAPEKIRAAIIGAYLDLYAKENDVDHIEKARTFIRSSKAGNAEKAWAYTYIVNRMATAKPGASLSNVSLISEMVDDAQTEIQSVADATQKDRLYYGLALVLTFDNEGKPVFDKDNLSKVHSFADQITSSKQRLQVMKKFAELGKTVTGLYPPAYAPLYEVLAMEEDEVSKEKLKSVYEKAVENDEFDVAITTMMMFENRDDRTEALFTYFESFFEKGDISRARRVAEKIENPSKAVNVWSNLAGYYLINGHKAESDEAYKKAESFVPLITKKDSQKKARTLIDERKERDKKKAEKKSREVSEADREAVKQALKAYEKQGIAAAVTIVRGIKDYTARVETFRDLAEKQTAKNDKYALLEHASQKDVHVLKVHSGDIVKVSSDAIAKYEQAIQSKQDKDPEGIHIHEGPESSDIGRFLSDEPLIERLNAKPEELRANIPLPGGYRIERSYYENNLYGGKFSEVLGSAGFTRQQGSSAPDVVVIDEGIADIPAIYDYLKGKGLGDYMTREGRTYTLRRPLIVNPKATLVVSGNDVGELRLSAEKGAFIASAGTVYILDTKFVAWNETENRPAWAKYEEKREFRPFYTAWSQSKTYMANTEFVAIGYSNGKSYGLSFSAGPNGWFKFGNDKMKKRPTAIVANNSFDNALYGFYSYEADDVVLTGNEYVGNIVYGIDPHDRSRRLAIGYNTAYDTHKKHGIIISREVDDSIIFGNLTFDNKGTGIMLDRDSNGTLVYGNTSFHNKQEGVTLFESDCEIIAANSIFENKGSGFRIRNSYNIGLFFNDIQRNGSSGISAYTAALKGDPVHKHRDFGLDPYDELTGVTAVGNTIEKNGTGMFVDKVTGLFLKENQFVDQSPKVLRGKMFKDNPEFLFRYDQKEYGTSVNAACPALAEPLYVQECKFRKNGILAGDGMDQLTDRIKLSACAKSLTDIKPHHEKVEEEIYEPQE
jgi:parallel beta-helix repeat protein